MRVWGLFFILLSTIPVESLAYPGFIAHGYATCRACHYNPLGNGPLTDYGRALGATLISGRPFWIKDDEEADEKTANQSGFLGPVKLPFWLRPAFGYRGMSLRPAIQDNWQSQASRWIDMQEEGSLTLQSKNSKWIISATYGKIPIPGTASPTDRNLYSTWISREHYISYQATKHMSVALGLMDMAYGLRVPEHNAYIRQNEGRNINDQNEGLLVQFTDKKWDLFLNPVFGNLQQDPTLQQKGFAATYEYEFFERARFGASAWYTKNNFKDRKMAGLFGRMGLTKNGAGLLGEITLINDKLSSATESTMGEVSFLQATAVMTRGLYFLFTFENSIANFKSNQNRTFRAGPTLQWFPFQRLELRADLLTTRSLGTTTLGPDDYTLLTQLHVWL